MDVRLAPPALERPATIHDVASLAGVSVGTASKAMNGQGRLRAETIERVRAAAAQLEYRPNELMQSVLRKRTHTVGLLTDRGALQHRHASGDRPRAYAGALLRVPVPGRRRLGARTPAR